MGTESAAPFGSTIQGDLELRTASRAVVAIFLILILLGTVYVLFKAAISESSPEVAIGGLLMTAALVVVVYSTFSMLRAARIMEHAELQLDTFPLYAGHKLRGTILIVGKIPIVQTKSKESSLLNLEQTPHEVNDPDRQLLRAELHCCKWVTQYYGQDYRTTVSTIWEGITTSFGASNNLGGTSFPVEFDIPQDQPVSGNMPDGSETRWDLSLYYPARFIEGHIRFRIKVGIAPQDSV